MKLFSSLFSMACALAVSLPFLPGIACAGEPNVPPEGYTALFNGKDLTGWAGGSTFDPRKLAAMPEAERIAQVQKWTDSMKQHWRVEAGELINDGEGDYASTIEQYGDFELLAEYKTVAGADSGIYLRGCPQVQIWDHTDKEKFSIGSDKGSGGLWNNSPGAPGKDPSDLADKPFGEWNSFHIIMTGSRVTVLLNEKMVVDYAIMENYFDSALPIPARGPIQLQTHGGEIRWRNIFIRPLSSAEANSVLRNHNTRGFYTMWNLADFQGWKGDLDSYEIKDGAIACRPGMGGTIYYVEEFTNFIARAEFRLPPGGNNGIAIRYPGEGDAAFAGMCEVQVLDDTAQQYAKLDPRQYCGSIYGVAPAVRGYLRPFGEWNFYEITVNGPTIKVELNGVPVSFADMSKVTPAMLMGNYPHPGKDRTTGYFGFAGHNEPVAFRNLSVKKLP